LQFIVLARKRPNGKEQDEKGVSGAIGKAGKTGEKTWPKGGARPEANITNIPTPSKIPMIFVGYKVKYVLIFAIDKWNSEKKEAVTPISTHIHTHTLAHTHKCIYSINICCNDNIDIDKRPQIYAQFG